MRINQACATKAAVEDLVRYLTGLYRDQVGSAVNSPAAEQLLKVRPESPPLDSDARERFHSAVAKLLYLAKRVRPEILPAISFLKKDPSRGIVLKADPDLRTRAYLCRVIEATLCIQE